MQTKALRRGLLLAFPLVWLASCASNPIVKSQPVIVKQPVMVSVPSQLTQPVAVPKLVQDPTNADLAHYVLMLRQAIADANAKLREIAGLK